MLILMLANHTHAISLPPITRPTPSFCCAGTQIKNLPFMIIHATVAGFRYCKEKSRKFAIIAISSALQTCISRAEPYPILLIKQGITKWEIQLLGKRWRYTFTPRPLRDVTVGKAPMILPTNQWRGKISTTPNTEKSWSKKHYSSSVLLVMTDRQYIAMYEKASKWFQPKTIVGLRATVTYRAPIIIIIFLMNDRFQI